MNSRVSKTVSSPLGGVAAGSLFALLLIIVALALFADAAAAAPGDQWVFGADSPVAPDLTYTQQTAAIDGDYVIWQGSIDLNGTEKKRVFFRNIADPDSPAVELSPPESANGNQDLYPEISGNLAVWLEGSTVKSIHYAYIEDGCPYTQSCVNHTLPIPAEARPAIVAVSGSRIVWEDDRAGHQTRENDIYYFDLADPAAGTRAVTTDTGNQTDPDVDGDWVVWRYRADYLHGSPGTDDIFARNLVTQEVIQVTTDGGANRQGQPAISGSLIAYHQSGDEDDGIFVFDLAAPTQAPSLAAPEYGTGVDISGDKVIWESSSSIVMLSDLSTGEVQKVSAGSGNVFHPAISDDLIVWTDARQTPSNVYHNRLGDRAQALAERYSPYLYLHHEEYFEPRPVSMFVDGEGTKLMERVENWPDNTLFEWPALDLGLLGIYFGASDQPQNPNGGKYIELPGNVSNAWASKRFTEWLLKRDFVNPYNDLVDQHQYPELYYVRVTRSPSGDRTAIQYWIPYYFNNFDNYHEGDWEMVQVDLKDFQGELSPRYVALSQHLGGIKGAWPYIERSGDHPVIYVARGSHASYFAAGNYHVSVENWLDATDYAEASEPIHEPQVEVLPDVSSAHVGSLIGGPFGWLAYQGAWGEIVGVPWLDAPQSPAAAPEHSGRWDDPFSWSDGLCNNGDPQCPGVFLNDTYGSVASPVDIHLYDSAGNHVGINEAGGIDEQVPGAEYIEIPELHRKTIIIHGGDASDGYRFVLGGTGEGTFDFTVGSPDKATNSADTVDYVAVPVTASSQVELNLVQNADYQLQIDNEGDGIIDQQRQPDSVAHHDIDLNPPAAVSDLSVDSISSDSVTISFTAPGDDGNAGSAQYYDVRYSETPITEMNWKEAEPAEIIPLPQPAGSPETLTISGLKSGTPYYFALKAQDEVLRMSELSNVAEATTTIPDLTWSITSTYWANWDDYNNRHLSIDYSMQNAGTEEAFDPALHASVCMPSSVYVVTSLPLATGDLAPGASETITLKYYVPSNVNNFTTITYASCKDDANREYWFPGPLP